MGGTVFTYLSNFGPASPFKCWRPFQIRGRITQHAINWVLQDNCFNESPLKIVTQYVNSGPPSSVEKTCFNMYRLTLWLLFVQLLPSPVVFSSTEDFCLSLVASSKYEISLQQ